jgi:hypothetical protein
MSRLGSNCDAYARIPLCRACGNPYVPPGAAGCCSVRCTHYLEVAREPVLGNPIFCQQDEPIRCWGCEVSFMSRGIRYCPECYFKTRPQAVPEVSSVPDSYAPGTPTPVRHDEPINDRNPRTRCQW